VSRFEEFREVYPKKQGMAAAKRKWDDRNLDNLADFIIPHVKKRALCDDKWLKGFIPMPTTFINQDRWEDEYDEVKRRVEQGPAVEIDPSVPSEGLLGAARYWDVCTEGLTTEQVEKLIWAKRHGGIHMKQLPESSHHLLENVKPPF